MEAAAAARRAAEEEKEEGRRRRAEEEQAAREGGGGGCQPHPPSAGERLKRATGEPGRVGGRGRGRDPAGALGARREAVRAGWLPTGKGAEGRAGEEGLQGGKEAVAAAAACAAPPGGRAPAGVRARAGIGGGAVRARPAWGEGAGSRAGGGRRLAALHLSAPLGSADSWRAGRSPEGFEKQREGV